MSKTQKILAVSLLFALVGTYFILNAAANSVTLQSPEKPHRQPAVSVPAAPNPQDIFTLVNDERVKAALPPLARDPRLDATAATKCSHIVSEDFWGHYEPNGTTPWDVIRAGGVTYKYAAENIAYEADTAKTITSWMNSPGHRANILDARYSSVGTAICHSSNFLKRGPRFIEVQQFIGL